MIVSWVVSTSAVDCVERLVSKMTTWCRLRPINSIHSLT